MERIINFVIDRNRIVIVLISLVSLFFGYYYLNQKIFNHIDIYFSPDDPALVEYKRFQGIYGNEELAIIALGSEDLFSLSKLEIVRRISDEAATFKGVQRVFSITLAEEAYEEGGVLYFRKIVPPVLSASDDFDSLRKRFTGDRLYRDSLVSSSGHATAILIELETMSDNDIKAELLYKIKKFADETAAGLKLHYSGSCYVEAEMNFLSKRDYLRFIPITLAIIFFLIFLMLRNIFLTFLSMINLMLVAVWGVGFMIFSGETINMVTTVISPILLAVSIADAIHLLSHYNERVKTGGGHTQAVRGALKAVLLPCVFTSITTAIGFLSFLTSAVRPPKIVGIFTASGVMFALVITLAFLPALMIFFKSHFEADRKGRIGLNADKAIKFTPLLEWMGSFVVREKYKIGAVFILLMAWGIYGISQVKFETNFTNYLPEDSELRRDIDFIDTEIGGTIPFIILIRANSADKDFTNPESLKLLAEIQKYLLEELPQFSSSFSVSDYIKEIHRAYYGRTGGDGLPLNKTDILDYYEIGDGDVFTRAVSPDRMEARLTFFSHWGSNEDAEYYNRIIQSYISGKIGSAYSYSRTGLAPLYLTMGDNLRESQIKSFISAFIVIFIAMFFVCGNLRLALVSMIPNIFPIVITLGIMGWFGIPLDVSTIMIASVTIGIAVDDTIHYITWLRRNISSGMDRESAVKKSIMDTGRPIVITTLVLVLGFLVLMSGSIKPTINFGVFTALSLFLALVGDLFVLPAAYLILGKKEV